MASQHLSGAERVSAAAHVQLPCGHSTYNPPAGVSHLADAPADHQLLYAASAQLCVVDCTASLPSIAASCYTESTQLRSTATSTTHSPADYANHAAPGSRESAAMTQAIPAELSPTGRSLGVLPAEVLVHAPPPNDAHALRPAPATSHGRAQTKAGCHHNAGELMMHFPLSVCQLSIVFHSFPAICPQLSYASALWSLPACAWGRIDCSSACPSCWAALLNWATCCCSPLASTCCSTHTSQSAFAAGTSKAISMLM